MRNVDSNVLTALSQADAFIDGHVEQLGSLESAGYRRKLSDAIKAFEQLAVDQVAAEQMSEAQLARQRALTAALRVNHMRPIAAIAAARLRDIPEFKSFRLPNFRARTLDLVIAAEAMAKIARQYAQVFIEAGLAPDFIEQLEAAAESLRQCITDRETSVTVRVGATLGLRSEAARGRKVLRVLSSLIEPRLRDDAALLTAWRTARHIRRQPRAQPAVFPLLGLALVQGGASSGPSVSTGAPADAIVAGQTPLALLPAFAPETVVAQPDAAEGSAFERAAQIITGDGGAEASPSDASPAP